MRTLAIVSLAAAFALPLAARAESIEDMSFDGIMKMKMIDTNKNNMVSKKEFLDMMGKMWDAKMKKMGVTGNAVTEAQMKEILMYLRAGG